MNRHDKFTLLYTFVCIGLVATFAFAIENSYRGAHRDETRTIETEQAFQRTCRVRTSRGTGSGFFVDTKSGVEIWTNGHVAGAAKGKCKIDIWTNGREKTIEGIVLESKVKGRTDYARIRPETEEDLPQCWSEDFETKPDSIDCYFTVGCPNGGRFECHSLVLHEEQKFAGIITATPESIPGQSGSLVFTKSGKLVGLVTYRFDVRGQEAFMGIVPINQFSNVKETDVLSLDLPEGCKRIGDL